jgi:selenide, water dikinase
MQPLTPALTDLVLLGAGHAHVEVLRRFALRPERGVRLTLIAREPHTPYSGMLPGLIRGDYGFDQAHIDLAPLAAAAGARLILAEATAIDLRRSAVAIAERPDTDFDLLSIDVGGVPAMPDDGGVPVKPIGQFLDHLAALEATLPLGARVAVVGGGAAGTELALALAHRLGARVRLVLVTAAAEPVADAPRRARSVARGALVEAGVEIVCGVTAGALTDGKLALSDGSFVEASAALWATNVVGPAFLAASGLDCDDAGCVRVSASLRSVSHPAVFAAGDCAAVEGAPRPKAGVWAVRAGAVLAENLRRAVRGRSPKIWRPQREALVIMGLGEGKGLAWRNGIALWGRPIWRWKDWIDRSWMRRYALRAVPAPGEQLRCGGAGAGLGQALLPDVPIELDAPDDAAAMRPSPGMLVVQSVAHFRACFDDPFVFGEIAAAHALSDLHAMGAKPWTALAIAAVPYMPAEKMRADLAAMMLGAERVLAADGCTLVGSHSTEALEASLGFAATGLAEPRLLWRKSRLREGDALVLTKPLGTGVLLAGHMRGLTKARWLVAAIDSMRHSNADAARVLRTHGVTACTGIGEAGLAGDLMEMLRASGAGAAIRPDAVPLLPGAAELAEQGVQSTLAPQNRWALPANASCPAVDLLTDPQTSGGLLAGVATARAEACIAALRAAGLTAAVIGLAEAAEPGSSPLRLLLDSNPAGDGDTTPGLG